MINFYKRQAAKRGMYIKDIERCKREIWNNELTRGDIYDKSIYDYTHSNQILLTSTATPSYGSQMIFVDDDSDDDDDDDDDDDSVSKPTMTSSSSPVTVPDWSKARRV